MARATWPDGPFRKQTPQTILVAAAISVRLRQAVEKSGLSITDVCGGLGIARSTYYDIINGTTLVDLHTLVRAQTFLGVRLWPDD